MANKRIAGIVEVTWNGKSIKVKGNVSTNIGEPKRDAMVGADSVHGYKEMPQAPFIEGVGSVVRGMSVKEIVNIVDATIICTMANGKKVMISEGWFEGEGTFGSEEADLPFRFSGEVGEELNT